MNDSDARRESGLRSRIGLFAGPALLLLILSAPTTESLAPEASRVAAVAVLMAVWWITEAIPIPATALLPLALFPILGVENIKTAAAPYANPVIFLFLGGFLIAQAVERWGLHRRIALQILTVVGTRPRRMIGGFMLATAFLSMWVSNTATAVMMLPIGVSVIELTRAPDEAPSHFAVSLMLGIAYAASIGGMGTLVGTPPNALFAGFMGETFGVEIGFAQWMAIGIPLVVILLPLAWLALTRWVFPVRLEEIPKGEESIRAELRGLGPLSRGEKQAGFAFLFAAAAWIVRPLLASRVPGLSDAGIAIFAGLLLFLLPVDFRRREFTLGGEGFRRIRWDVLILFGGGLSLAGAINQSGLAAWLGSALSGFGVLPLAATILIVTLLMVFLTELTSNTASTATFLPILASLAVGIGENPLLIVVPATLAASCAFMMPVATPPNAIIYGSGFVRVPQMAKVGLLLNLLFAILIPVLIMTWGAGILGAEPGSLPSWTAGVSGP